MFGHISVFDVQTINSLAQMTRTNPFLIITLGIGFMFLVYYSYSFNSSLEKKLTRDLFPYYLKELIISFPFPNRVVNGTRLI